MFESFNNFINNSMPLNEGMFSFKTLGDNKAISAMSGADIYMFDDKGNKWHEEDYEGYGLFGGKDFFELMAEMNGETGRDAGIDLYFGNDKKVLYPALTRDKNFNWKRHKFTTKIKSDPKQGAFSESVINEAKSIAKIQKEWAKVTAMMKDTVASYKEAEGKDKEDLLDQLKVLTISKKKLEVELDDAVGIKDMDVELAESSVITESLKPRDIKVGRGFKIGDDIFKIIEIKKDKRFGDIANTERIDHISGKKYTYRDTVKDLVDFFNEEGAVAEGMEFTITDVINESLNKRHVTLKRKYTENYPAITAGKSARIRNKMLEAIADGKITQEEFDTILKEMSIDTKRWSKRNTKYFNVSEDGVSLSKFGRRILNQITINEAESMINEKRENWIVYTGEVQKKFYSEHTGRKSAEKMVNMAMRVLNQVGMMPKSLWEKEEEEGFVVEDTVFIYESFKVFEANSVNESAFVVWYEDKEGKHILGTFHNKRAADKYKKEEEDEVLNTVGVESIGTMSRKMWDKNEAPYIKESIDLNEAFASSKLRNLLTMRGADGSAIKNLARAFYGLTKYKLDELPDAALRDVDPKTAYKSYQKDNEFAVFYIVDNEKGNPYGDRGWGRKIEPGIIAITRGKEFLGATHDTKKTPSTLTTAALDSAVGGDKRYSGYGATGIYNVKRAAELADRAIVVWLNNDAFKSTDKIEQRADAKAGAIAFTSDKEFKATNMARYKEILASNAAKLPLDKIVESAIEELTKQIAQALKDNNASKYDGILIGTSPRGREVTIKDAGQHMSNILDDYSRYSSYMKNSDEERASGYSSGFYEKEAKNYAKRVTDGAKKIKKMDYAW
jgi:hypothetical protein